VENPATHTAAMDCVWVCGCVWVCVGECVGVGGCVGMCRWGGGDVYSHREAAGPGHMCRMRVSVTEDRPLLY